MCHCLKVRRHFLLQPLPTLTAPRSVHDPRLVSQPASLYIPQVTKSIHNTDACELQNIQGKVLDTIRAESELKLVTQLLR